MISGPAQRAAGWTLLTVVVVMVLLTSAAASLTVGSVDIPLSRVAAVLVRRAGLWDDGVTVVEDQLVWQLRLPRALGAMAVGAILAMSGAVLQALTRNDLADPFLLGVSSGASVGAVTVIVLGLGVAGLASHVMLASAAFVGALVALAVVLLIASWGRGSLSPHRTILAGVAVAHLCGAYTSIVTLMHGEGDAARRVLSWTLGSLAGVRWTSAALLICVCAAALLWFMTYAHRLDAFAFGETSARSLGIPVTATRWALMIGTALATAASVAVAGVIGFVGLVVPHLVRPLIGHQHRAVLPASALVGALLLLGADATSRSLIRGQELPIGALTAFLGVPALIWILSRSKNT